MVSGETSRITRSKSTRKATTNRPPRDAARRTTGGRKAIAPARRAKKEKHEIVSDSDDANLGTVHVPRRSTTGIRSLPPTSVTPQGSVNSKPGAPDVDLGAILFRMRGKRSVEGGTTSHQLEVSGDQGRFDLEEVGGDQDEFQVIQEDSVQQGGLEVEEDNEEYDQLEEDGGLDQLGGGGSSGFQALPPPQRNQFVKLLTTAFNTAALDIVATYDEMLDTIKAAFEEEKKSLEHQLDAVTKTYAARISAMESRRTSLIDRLRRDYPEVFR